MKKTVADARFKNIKSLRDNFLAHNNWEAAAAGKTKVGPMKLGDEKWLVEQSIIVVEALYSAINGVGYSYEETRKIFARQSDGFWKNIDFSKIQ